jgi:hypothetical protein
MELGILTPEEGIKAIESNILPSKEESLESQKVYKGQREDGLYQPLIGAPKDGSSAGRPEGVKAPQTTKKISPIGTKASELYSLSKIKENLIVAQDLDAEIEKHLKKKFKIKKLNDQQQEVANSISSLVMTNEDPANWVSCVASYCDKPVDSNPDRVKQVDEISANHGVDNYLASLLYVSKK